jgi:putative ATP-dependent endonuclease of the OLD family
MVDPVWDPSTFDNPWSPVCRHTRRPTEHSTVRIAQLTLTNFQCFGPSPTTIEFDDLTALIGANGSGKTAVLQALCRLFGTTAATRTLTPDDFHVPPTERRGDADERQLRIEARLEFPELDEGETAGSGAAVPTFFRHMTIHVPGGVPYCRLRLEGTWTNTATPGGDVEPKYAWITSPEGEAPETVARAEPRDRSAVQVYYIPASRDTTRQLGNVSGTLLNRLIGAIDLDGKIRAQITDAAKTLRELFTDMAAVKRIDRANLANWQELHDDAIYSTPTLRFVAGDPDDVLRDTQIVFTPNRGDVPHDITRLSDGQRSLFYFAFINTIFGIEREVYDGHHATANASVPSLTPTEGNGHAGNIGGSANAADGANGSHVTDSLTTHISYARLRPAPLTVFAFEEPENHLGPHYLGRIVHQVGQIAANPGAQVIMTSHSSAAVSRIDPRKVRYIRCTRDTGESSVQAVTLPENDVEAAKYVREAVRAYPELYFARLVILCEGDSEEVLLPKFASAAGSPLDLAFVSVVPLGGRHVNHLWRLLNDLGIPHITLLDLDRERETGGWRTIRYVVRELRRVLGTKGDARLRTVSDGGTQREYDIREFDQLLDSFDERSDGDARLAAWITHLRLFNVFFSEPLDLDFLMLRAYPEAYRGLARQGPRGLQGPGREERITKAVHAVLGADATGNTYQPEERELFAWYSHLFYGRGKPSTHTAAWVTLDPATRLERMPEPLQALLSVARTHLGASSAQPCERADSGETPEIATIIADDGPLLSAALDTLTAVAEGGALRDTEPGPTS